MPILEKKNTNNLNFYLKKVEKAGTMKGLKEVFFSEKERSPGQGFPF